MDYFHQPPSQTVVVKVTPLKRGEGVEKEDSDNLSASKRSKTSSPEDLDLKSQMQENDIQIIRNQPAVVSDYFNAVEHSMAPTEDITEANDNHKQLQHDLFPNDEVFGIDTARDTRASSRNLIPKQSREFVVDTVEHNVFDIDERMLANDNPVSNNIVPRTPLPPIQSIQTTENQRKIWERDMDKALHQVFHLRRFRNNQREAVFAALEGKDAFVLMPTGFFSNYSKT